MPKSSKILIAVFLVLSLSAGFAVFHFSNAQNSVNDISSTETSNQNLISLENPFPGEGTVYICPEAASLTEINPRCPGRIILKLGETIDGLTLTTTDYEGQEYYMVLGFENGGGAVNLPPTANAQGPYEGYAGLSITFDASSSTDPNNDPLQYRWDFNDDGIWDTDWLSTSTRNHIWNDGYEGTVKLEVNDGEFAVTATTSVKVIPWEYIFNDTFGRNTTLKINTAKRYFQFIAPTFNTGVIEAPGMIILEVNSSMFKYQTRTKTWIINLSKLNLPLEIKSLIALYSFKELPKEIILIPYQNKEIIFNAIALDSKVDFCAALLYQKATKKTYLLIDKPGVE